jgi:hypothetical protein
MFLKALKSVLAFFAVQPTLATAPDFSSTASRIADTV